MSELLTASHSKKVTVELLERLKTSELLQMVERLKSKRRRGRASIGRSVIAFGATAARFPTKRFAQRARVQRPLAEDTKEDTKNHTENDKENTKEDKKSDKENTTSSQMKSAKKNTKEHKKNDKENTRRKTTRRTRRSEIEGAATRGNESGQSGHRSQRIATRDKRAGIGEL